MPRHRFVLLFLFGFVCLPLAGAQQPGAKKNAPAAALAKGGSLPPGALVRLGATRIRMSNSVSSVTFSADGKVLASADYDGVVRLTVTATGKTLLELPPGTGRLVRFTLDGKHLVCAGSEAGLILVEAATGKPLRVFADKERGQRAWSGHSYVSHGIALSPDTQLLAEGINNEVVVWDTATGKEVRRFKGHPEWMYSVAFSPDGKMLAGGGGLFVNPSTKGNTSILLWDVATGNERRRLQTSHLRMYALAFAPDGKTLAAISPDAADLWDVATGRKRADLGVSGWDLAYSPDGSQLALAGRTTEDFLASIHVWDTASGKRRHELRGHDYDVCAVAFAPDNKTLASGGREGTVRLWDTAVGKELVLQDGHQAAVRAVAFSSNGILAATASGGDHTIRVWNTAKGTLLHTLKPPCNFRSHLCPTSMEFALDGTTLLCDQHVFDAAAGKALVDLPGKFLAQSTDGKLLAAAGEPFGGWADLKVWERATNRVVAQFVPLGKEAQFDSQVTAAAFSPDGKIVAGAVLKRLPDNRKKKQETVYLYDIAAKKLLRKFGAEPVAAGRLLFSPDGELLAVIDMGDQAVTFYRVADGQEYRRLPAEGGWGNRWDSPPIAFSPDGRLLAVGGMKEFGIAVIEVVSGKEVHRLLGHEAPVNGLAFAPDGRRLLAAGEEGSGLIWNLAPVEAKKAPLQAKELDALWKQLASDDAAAAYRAAWRLAAEPDRALVLFKDRLKPLPEPDLKVVPKLIADLAANKFAVRDAAVNQLKQLGPLSEPGLRKALAAKPPLEVQRRIEQLLAELQERKVPPEELRQMRAVQILGWIGTPAVNQLDVLACGNPTLRPNRDAEAILRRLANRRPAPLAKVAPAVLTKLAPAAKPRELPGPKAEVTALSFAKDGALLTVATADGLVRLHDSVSGKVLRQFRADAAATLAVAFSPNGKTLATGGSDRTVRLWEVESGKPLGVYKGHTGAITSVDFSPDGKTLASGSLDKMVRLWDVATGRSLYQLAGHEGIVTSVVFAHGKTVASGELIDGDQSIGGKNISTHFADTVRLWDVVTGKAMSKLPEGGHRVTFAPGGRILAFAELGTEMRLPGMLIGKGARGTFVGGGPYEVTFRGMETIVLWDLAAGESRLRLNDVGTAFAFSPDGRFLATGCGSDLHHGGKLLQTPGVVTRDGRLRLWEIATGKEVLAFPAKALPTILAFAADGRTIAAGTREGAVYLWDLAIRDKDDKQPAWNEKDFAKLWSALASDDAAAAYRAAWALRAAGPKALPFLREHLQPTPADDPQLHRFIQNLGADRFAVREEASQALAQRGADAAPALLLALKRAPSEAVRHRLLALLEAPGIKEYPEPLARSRVLGVLEAIGTAEARRLLEVLARGAPLSRQTQEAADSLERLARR